MTIKETEAKSILRKQKKVDSWFVARYGMNLYRGCTHDCIYCDGRAEGYYVEGEFGKDVTVKTNAQEVLQRELSPEKKRIPLKRGFVMTGGGVGDSYQPVEKEYGLSRGVLQLVNNFDFPVHILTKSTLVERDIDILKEINDHTRAIVSFSFSSVDDELSALFEPNVPSPTRRLETIATLKNEGISCGMFLLPVIPFITDTPGLIDQAVLKAKEAGVDFVIFGGMTLKQGRQKETFFRVLKRHYGEMVPKYDSIYANNKWGMAENEYYQTLNRLFMHIAHNHAMPVRMPEILYRDLLDENDLVVVTLEHIDYLLKMRGQKSPYGYAAYSISRVRDPLSEMKGNLTNIKGVGPSTERIILDILKNKSSSYYKKLQETI